MKSWPFSFKLIWILSFDVLSAVFGRFYEQTLELPYAILSILSLILAGYGFIMTLQNRVTILMNALWIALGTLNVTLASYLLFGETLNWTQGIGIILIVLGVILLHTEPLSSKK